MLTPVRIEQDPTFMFSSWPAANQVVGPRTPLPLYLLKPMSWKGGLCSPKPPPCSRSTTMAGKLWQHYIQILHVLIVIRAPLAFLAKFGSSEQPYHLRHLQYLQSPKTSNLQYLPTPPHPNVYSVWSQTPSDCAAHGISASKHIQAAALTVIEVL